MPIKCLCLCAFWVPKCEKFIGNGTDEVFTAAPEASRTNRSLLTWVVVKVMVPFWVA